MMLLLFTLAALMTHRFGVPGARADVAPPCAQVRAEFKRRFDAIPRPLRRLGGERRVVRKYLSEPTKYFEDGVTTACQTTAVASDMRVDPKLQCPQGSTITFNFPSAMARDPKSAAPLDTVYLSLTLSTIGPAPHLELPLDAFKFNGDGFSAEAPNRRLSYRPIDPTHGYLEWTQKAEVASQRTQRVLIESDAADGDFEHAVPLPTECR